MSGTLSIRAGGAGDVPAVLALWARARSANASMPDTPEGLTQLLERSPGALLVADADGAIAGIVIAARDGWGGNMYRLAVDPAHRRRGIALALVRAGVAGLWRSAPAGAVAVALADCASRGKGTGVCGVPTRRTFGLYCSPKVRLVERQHSSRAPAR